MTRFDLRDVFKIGSKKGKKKSNKIVLGEKWRKVKENGVISIRRGEMERSRKR